VTLLEFPQLTSALDMNEVNVKKTNNLPTGWNMLRNKQGDVVGYTDENGVFVQELPPSLEELQHQLRELSLKLELSSSKDSRPRLIQVFDRIVYHGSSDVGVTSHYNLSQTIQTEYNAWLDLHKDIEIINTEYYSTIHSFNPVSTWYPYTQVRIIVTYCKV
jgi:hypothetical protein